MFKNRSGRSGFTLPEVLVTVAIVAVLAAVVVPAVTQQLGRGDAPSFQTSVNSLRTAITSFVSDVRTLPGEVEHLQRIITNGDFTLSGDGAGNTGVVPVAVPDYSNGQVARWRGPYDNSSTSTGLVGLGMDWTTTNVLYDSTGYLVVEITRANAVVADAQELDDLVDDGVATTGLVRWEADGGTPTILDPPNMVRLFLMSSAR